MRNTIFLMLLTSLSLSATSRQEHAKTCPESCKVCDDVVEKALKFIVAKQEKDGGWGENSPWNREYREPYTALNALALIASGSTTKEGPFKAQLHKAKDAAIKYVIPKLKHREFKTIEERIAHDGYEHVGISLTAIFLSHVYKSDPSGELMGVLEKIRDFLINQQRDDGGWNYRLKGTENGSDTSIKGYPFLATSNGIALLMMRHVGVDIPDTLIGKVKAYFSNAEIQMSDGGIMYFPTKPPPPEKPGVFKIQERIGRTVAALWPMHLLGLSNTERFKKARGFAEKYFSEIDCGKHGPSYHMFWGGMACFYYDKELWKRYNENYRKSIAKSQNGDGGICLEPRKEAVAPVDRKKAQGSFECGPIYTTPQYAIILQLHKGNLLLGQLVKNGK